MSTSMELGHIFFMLIIVRIKVAYYDEPSRQAQASPPHPTLLAVPQTPIAIL